ncbi:MAG: GNAT family N-acetyltransferase [Ferruginibacter sp.]|nr:GNAT family N-acetyltransferase [Cytophagales bacterium]
MPPDEFTVSTDRSRLDLAVIHGFLSRSYWAKNIPKETVQRSIEHSLCFGVYHRDQQVGFARVISDFSTVAYVCDVFILEPYRGEGLSKQLMSHIKGHPDLQGLRRWMLVTRDAHGLYEQFGFTNVAHPERYLEIVVTNAYG